MRKSNLGAVVFASSAFVAATAQTAAFAQPPVDVTTEVMMEDTAANNEIVASLFGPSLGSTLSYTTDVMSSGDYTYSTVPGSMLDGNAISLSGGATFSSPGGVCTYNTYENGDYKGSPYWSVIDKETVTPGILPGSYKIVSDYTWTGGNGNYNDLHIEVTVLANLLDFDTGYFTKNGLKIPKSDFISFSYNSKGNWKIWVLPVYPPQKPVPMPIVEAGFTPSLGGDGTFTVSFVPEPSTWAMMLLGFAGLGFAGYRATRRSAALPG
jgi:hypothetical protein